MSELVTCSRNPVFPSAAIYLPGLMLIPQDKKKKVHQSPFPADESWYCSVSLSPHIPERGDELEWEYPSQFHSCETFQITGGGNAGHYDNHLPQEAVILGLSCSWHGWRSPSGSDRIDLNIPFNIAQHECRWALGTETLAWSWLFWGQSKASPLRTFVLRAVLVCAITDLLTTLLLRFCCCYGMVSFAGQKFLTSVKSNLTLLSFTGHVFDVVPKELSPNPKAHRLFSYAFF